MNEKAQSNKDKSKENLLINFAFIIILPILILRKGDDWFGGLIGKFVNQSIDSTLVASILLAFAVSFPVGYGLYDFARRKKWNFFSILGTISALLTGVLV